jgi:hypothetical protein
MNKTFGILFLLTGIFAIIGGLYTWGEGSIFNQNELLKVLIPWADIILTGPISILCGIGIIKKQYFGYILGLITSGIYIFGTTLVFVTMCFDENQPLYLFIPAFSGLFIGLGFIIWILIIKKISLTK